MLVPEKKPEEMTDAEFRLALYKQGFRFGDVNPRKPMSKRRERKAMQFINDLAPKDPAEVASKSVGKGMWSFLTGLVFMMIGVDLETDGNWLAIVITGIFIFGGMNFVLAGMERWIKGAIALEKLKEER